MFQGRQTAGMACCTTSGGAASYRYPLWSAFSQWQTLRASLYISWLSESGFSSLSPAAAMTKIWKCSRLADWTYVAGDGGGTKLLHLQPWKLHPLAVPTVAFDIKEEKKKNDSSFRVVCTHRQCSLPGQESLWFVRESELEHGDLLQRAGCAVLDKLLHSFWDCAQHPHTGL